MEGSHLLPNTPLESRERASEPRQSMTEAVVLPSQIQRNVKTRIKWTVLQENKITKMHAYGCRKPAWL